MITIRVLFLGSIFIAYTLAHGPDKGQRNTRSTSPAPRSVTLHAGYGCSFDHDHAWNRLIFRKERATLANEQTTIVETQIAIVTIA